MEEFKTVAGAASATWPEAQPDDGGAAGLPEKFSDEELFKLARPVVVRVLRHKLRQAGVAAGPLPELLEELAQEAALRLFRYAQGRHLHAVESLAVSVATSVFADYARRQAPELYNLRRRLVALLQQDEYFACWKNDAGQEICGLRQWRNESPFVFAATALQALAQKLQPLCYPTVGSMSPARFLTSILETTKCPVRLRDVLDLARQALSQPAVLSLDVLTETGHFQPIAPGASPEDNLAGTATLQLYWQIIRALKWPQACALLLGSVELRHLLVKNKVASKSQIAAVVRMPGPQFSECWDLALSDQTIAAFLNFADANEVSYHRRLARDLLRRRFKQ